MNTGPEHVLVNISQWSYTLGRLSVPYIHDTSKALTITNSSIKSRWQWDLAYGFYNCFQPLLRARQRITWQKLGRIFAVEVPGSTFQERKRQTHGCMPLSVGGQTLYCWQWDNAQIPTEGRLTRVFVFSYQSYKLAVELKPDQSQAWMNMGGIQHIKVMVKHQHNFKHFWTFIPVNKYAPNYVVNPTQMPFLPVLRIHINN